jgi:hypothetical protein
MCEQCDARERTTPRTEPCGYRKCRHTEAQHGYQRRDYTGQDGRAHHYYSSRRCEVEGCPCQYYRTAGESSDLPVCVKCGESFLRHDSDDKHRTCPECREPYQRTPEEDLDVVERMRREHRRYGVDLDAA